MKRVSYTTKEVSFGNAELYRNGNRLNIHVPYNGAYGMGEKYDSLNQKGKTVINQVREKFCFQGNKTYCPTPFFWTDTGFGLYVDTCEVTTFNFGESCIEIELPETADVVLFSGTPEEMIREYMSLFGPAVLPPEWTMGIWISANRWNTQKDVGDLLAKLKKHDFPASIVVLEAWSDEATFYIWNGAKYQPVPNGQALKYEDFDFSGTPWPDPAKMVTDVHDAGLKMLLWQVPVYKKQGDDEIQNAQNDLDREDAAVRKLCVTMPDGTPYTIPKGNWFPDSMVPDFTNPETVKSWFAKRQYLLDIGVDGFKTDGGEFIHHPDAQFHNGTTGKEGVNRYSRDYTESYRDFVGSNGVIFSRAGFSGQHTVPCHWGGDQQSQNSELASVLKAGLSAAASGMIFWGFDLAGFAGPLPTLDLYRRATQMACFCPIMQWHSEPDGGQFRELMPGAEGNNERSPWNMEESYVAPGFMDEMRYWHKLHEKLRPYLWKTAQDCVRDSKPFMRPLIYEWPNDVNAVNCQDEYLLGDDLLVAPLLEENATYREVYLPDGVWFDFFDGTEYSGNQTITAGKDGKLPVFTRNGFELEK
ncbi:MAG: glycoside hydrolase family 31 protein [Oscillospiraceae bacterium]|nr:glycoside hydrolase family 31 protein [Oscillospiraceae bacterium]